MAWYALPLSIAYYVLLPFITIFNFLLVLISPVTHSISYALHAVFLPFSVLGKFEVCTRCVRAPISSNANNNQTLYIFFGIAAIIGLFTGTFLHFTSSILITALDLRPGPEDSKPPTRTMKSIREAREKRQLDEAWSSSLLSRSKEIHESRDRDAKERMEAALGGQLKYDDLARNNGRALQGTTILEEEDDSEDDFM